MTSDGKPYRKKRYKEIVKERYLISKHTNTSYVDVDTMTPTERTYVILFIVDDFNKIQELRELQNSK